MALAVAASFAAAVVSWRFIETPFRRPSGLPNPRLLLRYVAALGASLGARLAELENLIEVRGGHMLQTLQGSTDVLDHSLAARTAHLTEMLDARNEAMDNTLASRTERLLEGLSERNELIEDALASRTDRLLEGLSTLSADQQSRLAELLHRLVVYSEIPMCDGFSPSEDDVHHAVDAAD